MMTTRRVIQQPLRRGFQPRVVATPTPEPTYTMKRVEYDHVPRETRQAKDYHSPSKKDLYHQFPQIRPYYHKNAIAMYALADMVLKRLGYGVLLTHPNTAKDIDKFQVELSCMLGYALAYGLAAPQRCNNQPRNIVVGELIKFTYRIYRFAGGHKVKLPDWYTLSKKDFGYLIDEIMNDGWVWNYAEMCVKFYERKLARGDCDEI